MEGINDNFLVQMIGKPTRRGALLDLIPNKERLVGHVKVEGNLGGSDHEMVEFRTQRGGSERGKKQDHSPGQQESRFFPSQRCAWKMRNGSRPSCERSAEVQRTLPGGGQGVNREPMDED